MALASPVMITRDKDMPADLRSSPVPGQPVKETGQGRRTRRKKASSARSRNAQLTRRQEEVLRLVATGLTNKEVAAQLGLSVGTIESHLHSIYGKIGVRTRGAAIRFAVDHGLMEPRITEIGEENT